MADHKRPNTVQTVLNECGMSLYVSYVVFFLFTVRLFLGLALCWVAGSAFAAKRPAPALDEKFTPAQVREDFRVLRSALEKLHPGLHLHTPKAELKQLLGHFDHQIQQMQVTQLQIILV